jgi:hypothetical protein
MERLASKCLPLRRPKSLHSVVGLRAVLGEGSCREWHSYLQHEPLIGAPKGWVVDAVMDRVESIVLCQCFLPTVPSSLLRFGNCLSRLLEMPTSVLSSKGANRFLTSSTCSMLRTCYKQTSRHRCIFWSDIASHRRINPCKQEE